MLPDTPPENLPEAVANLALGLVPSETSLEGSTLPLPRRLPPVPCQEAVTLPASGTPTPASLCEVAPAEALGEPQSKGVLLTLVGPGRKGDAGESMPWWGKELTLLMRPVLLCSLNSRYVPPAFDKPL